MKEKGNDKMNNNNNEESIGVKEIARLANVSLATVDRVLHNRTGVSETTRAKIQKIIKRLNYRPNILARRLASGKVYRFAVLIPAVSEETAYWQAPLNGINRAESELSQYGIKIERYFFDQNDKKSFLEKAKVILENEIDGVVMAPSFIEESIHFTNSCKELKIPYVFINSDIPTQKSLCYIGPELFKSGYLAASLAGYSKRETGKILVVNIVKEIDNQHHVVRKEEGFRTYFKDKKINADIIEMNINQTDYKAVEKSLTEVFERNPDITSIFVTNSRVFSVAKFMEKKGRKNVLLIGYDYIEENIQYLKNGKINFLICQKPEEQGYRGIMALYHHLILKIPIANIDYMPIDIITKENYEFYKN
ncbi:MAG: LacI family DNA-binding transcriptional regulator [Cyclobacteriaceae bacterium]